MSTIKMSTISPRLKDIEIKNDNIIMKDWAGNVLFQGPYNDTQVDAVLNANRCECDHDEDCHDCNGDGYAGDFSVEWLDYTRTYNVYEYINY